MVCDFSERVVVRSNSIVNATVPRLPVVNVREWPLYVEGHMHHSEALALKESSTCPPIENPTPNGVCVPRFGMGSVPQIQGDPKNEGVTPSPGERQLHDRAKGAKGHDYCHSVLSKADRIRRTRSVY